MFIPCRLSLNIAIQSTFYSLKSYFIGMLLQLSTPNLLEYTALDLKIDLRWGRVPTLCKFWAWLWTGAEWCEI